jgi:D-3-phosphoglycerate dehydrogenase
LRAVFVDATDTLAAIAERQLKAGDPAIAINRQPTITPP